MFKVNRIKELTVNPTGRRHALSNSAAHNEITTTTTGKWDVSHAADVFVLNPPRRRLLADLFMRVFFFLYPPFSVCESPLLLLSGPSAAGGGASLGPLSCRALFVLAPPGCCQRRGTWPGGTRQRRLLIIHRLSTPIAALLPSSSSAAAADIIRLGEPC